MKLLLIILTVASFSCNAQNISSNLSINGGKCAPENKCVLSRSKENILTIEGEGCDAFVLSGSNVSLTKSLEGWIASPGKGGWVQITISCKEDNGKTVNLISYSLEVVP